MNYLPTRNDLGSLLPADSVGAEIGVRRGYFSVHMLQHWPIERLYLIDPWKNPEGYHDPVALEDQEANLAETMANVRSFGDKAFIIRGESTSKSTLRAVNMDSGMDIDWIFLDANHSYDAVLTDLWVWSAWINHGGYIFGHDYCTSDHSKKWGFDVIGAVTQFCKESDWELTHLTEEETPSFVLERRK